MELPAPSAADVSRPAPAPDGKADSRRYWTWFGIAALLLVAPVAWARYPPVLDLPQLVSQARLFGEALGGSSTYRIQWFAPDKIGYFPILLGWWMGGAAWGPRLGLALSIVLGAGAVFVLARRVGTPPEHGALAAAFVLARPLHVGLLNFVVGTLPFFLWIDELRQPVGRRDGRRAAGRAFLFGWALYFSHALLLAGAVGLTLVAAMRRRPEWRGLAARLSGLGPAFLACALWYLHLARQGWRSHPHWILGPVERLTEPRAWRLYLLGSVRGPEEPLILAALALWAVLCLAGAGKRALPDATSPLLRFAGCMLGVAWLFPEGIGDTVFFAQRWAPLAAILVLLALPRAPIRRGLAAGFALALIVAWSATVSAAWRGFDREEMPGFGTALAAVPAHARLLTLDFLRISPRFFALPFFQMGGYAQIERGAEPASSFADQPTSPVVFRHLPRPVPWARRLENFPLALGTGDLRYFDDVLLHADPDTRDRFLARFPGLTPAAGAGNWWLLSVRPAWPSASVGGKGGMP